MTEVQQESRFVSDDELAHWRAEGCVVVEGLFDAEDLARAHADLARLVPSFEQVHDDGAALPPMSTYPFRADALDELALHPAIIDFAERALGGPVVLSHAEMLHKYAGRGDFDQPLHQDYGNNSMVVPSLTAPDQMASITFLTDSTIEMGATGYVGFTDAGPWQHIRQVPRDAAPELYALERRACVPAGSTLFYTQRTFHRGAAITAVEGVRHTLHVAHMRAHVTWAGWRNISTHGNFPYFVDLLTRLSVQQRSVLGFPRPGDPYWTAETVELMQRRYPDMDLAPYSG